MNTDQVFGLIRHILTIVGGIFIAKGKLDPATADSIIGGVLSIGGAAWSYSSKKK